MTTVVSRVHSRPEAEALGPQRLAKRRDCAEDDENRVLALDWLPVDRYRFHLVNLRHDLDELNVRIADPASDPTCLRAHAHPLISAAAILGFKTLGLALQAFEQGCSRGSSPDAGALRTAMAVTMDTIERRLRG